MILTAGRPNSRENHNSYVKSEFKFSAIFCGFKREIAEICRSFKISYFMVYIAEINFYRSAAISVSANTMMSQATFECSTRISVLEIFDVISLTLPPLHRVHPVILHVARTSSISFNSS